MTDNINRKIEARLAENKSSIKTYSTYEKAERVAVSEAIAASRAFVGECVKPVSFTIAYLPETMRFTPVFNLSEFMRKHGCGGYVFHFAAKGFAQQ